MTDWHLRAGYSSTRSRAEQAMADDVVAALGSDLAMTLAGVMAGFQAAAQAATMAMVDLRVALGGIAGRWWPRLPRKTKKALRKVLADRRISWRETRRMHHVMCPRRPAY
jgi:hypothetical protein